MALALDGSAHVNNTTSVSLSTSSSDDVIAAVVTINDGSVTGISSSNTTGWARRKQQANSGGNFIELWYGKASSPLSSESLSVSVTGFGFLTIDVFGISGANTTQIYDSNGALPDGQTTGTCSITTSSANTFLIGAYRFGVASPTQGSGWTIISGANFQLVEYKIVAATQSGLTVAIGDGDGQQNAGIADAVVQAGAAAGNPWYYRAQQALVAKRRIFLPANDLIIARAA